MNGPPMTQPAARRLDPAWSGPVFFFALGLCFLAIPLLHAVNKPDCSGNKDYTFWYEIGRDVRAGLPLYAPMFTGEVKYMYPPTLAVLVYAPLTHLGPVGFVLALGSLSALAWVAAIWAATVLMAGRWAGHARWLYLVPGLAVGSYVWDIQLLGQINLVLLALVLLSFVALRHQRPIAAGTLLGLAAAMKAFPLTALAYFVVRRQWMAVAATLVALAGFVWFVPACVRGFERTNGELRQWAGHMVADQSGKTIGARHEIAFTRRNHSLVSVSHRLLRDVDAGDDLGYFAVNFANVSPATAQWIGYGSVLGLGALLLACTRLRFAETPLAEGLEAAMVCILVVLASPLSFTYFYCWLLPAWAAIAWLWAEPNLPRASRRVVELGTGIAAVLLASAVTEQFDPTLQALGVTTWGSLTLFLTIAWVRFSLPRQVAAHPVAYSLRRAA